MDWVFFNENIRGTKLFLGRLFLCLAVYILEDALSARTDNASVAVLILWLHYPSERTWANICISSGYASRV